MPSWDLSLAELQSYGGTNPRPEDLDEYWADALEELDAEPASVEVVPVELGYRSVQCFDVWFTGIGGARVHAKHLRPRAGATGAGVAMFHGYTWRSPDWFEMVPYAAEGFTVLALDCRGQGGLSEDASPPRRATQHGHIVRGLTEGPRALLYRSIFTDLVRTVRVLMEMPDVDPARVGVTGGSQGGGLSLACAALEPRVKAAAAVFPFLCDYQRVWELDLAENAYAELREWFRRFDPTHERIDETFRTLGYIDVQHLAPRIEASVLMITGLMDKICPPSTQFAAYNRITAPKSVVTYPDYEHEVIPDANDRVLRFLRDTLAPAPASDHPDP